MTFGLGFLTWEKVMNFKIFLILNIVLVWGQGRGGICSFLMVSFIFKFLALLNRNYGPQQLGKAYLVLSQNKNLIYYLSTV